MVRKEKGVRGGGGVGSKQVLLRGDADDLMVDALVTAEKHERRMTMEGGNAKKASERAAARRGGGDSTTTTGRGENGKDAPRFGRELVPFFIEGCSGGNLEADVNHDLTDRNQNYNSYYSHNYDADSSQKVRVGGGMTARQTMDVAPLPVPSNLIPQSNMHVAQQPTKTAKNAKRASKKKTSASGKEQHEQNTGRKGNVVVVQTTTHSHQQPKKSGAPVAAASAAPERWAAPSFSNSPKPETIPMPPATLLYPR